MYQWKQLKCSDNYPQFQYTRPVPTLNTDTIEFIYLFIQKIPQYLFLFFKN